MRRALRAGLVCTALAVLAGCGDPTAEPGVLLVTVGSPNGAEGAAVVELNGSNLGDVEGVESSVLTQRTTTGLLVVVLRDTPGRLEFRLHVPNVHAPPVGRIVQVADGEDALRANVDAYRVRYRR